MKTVVRLAALMCAGALAACGSGGTAPSTSPTPTPSSSVSPSTAAPEPSQTGTTSPTACASFGSTDDVTSTDPLALSTLTGREIRVGEHPCYDRFVLELQGSGDFPGWRLGYRDPLIADPSGLTVSLRGDANLEMVVGVWAVTPYEGRPPEQLPLEGPTEIVTDGYTALQEARVISSFEGMTQIGLGIDRVRPFKVTVLTGPPRIVVDIATS